MVVMAIARLLLFFDCLSMVRRGLHTLERCTPLGGVQASHVEYRAMRDYLVVEVAPQSPDHSRRDTQDVCDIRLGTRGRNQRDVSTHDRVLSEGRVECTSPTPVLTSLRQ